MRIQFKHAAIVFLCSSLFSSVSFGLVAADEFYSNAATQQRMWAPDISEWDPATLYHNGWSAVEMMETSVRGENGRNIGDVKDIVVDHSGSITQVIVEVGGFLGIGGQHIGIPWNDVQIGPDMEWVQVPLREVERGTFSLYGEVPQDEQVPIRPAAWRANELIGDYASLVDTAWYGRIHDVIFDDQGKAQAIVISRSASPGDRYGFYAYPYVGYYADQYVYPLPYRSEAVKNMRRFDYVKLGELSRFSGAAEASTLW